MIEASRTALKQLQKLDLSIQEARQRVRDFDPKFEEVEEPALILGSEAEKTRNRLQEMKLEERRLELGVEEKKARQERLEERLGSVRNLREEAAVSAELEMVKRALQGDEQEAYSLLDQIRKLEERLEELEEALTEAKAQVEPALADLVKSRDAAKEELASLEAQRADFAAEMETAQVKLYDGIRKGGRSIAVSVLTEDGACGHCYGMVPLQLQNEVRGGDTLIRCEACGVILTAPDPEEEAAEKAKADARAAAAAAEAADAVTSDDADDQEADEAAEAAAEADEVVEAATEDTAAEEAPPAEPEASAVEEAPAAEEAPAEPESAAEPEPEEEPAAPTPARAAEVAAPRTPASAEEPEGDEAGAEPDADTAEVGAASEGEDADAEDTDKA